MLTTDVVVMEVMVDTEAMVDTEDMDMAANEDQLNHTMAVVDMVVMEVMVDMVDMEDMDTVVKSYLN